MKPLRRQFVSSEEAKPAERQHTKPCGDCPFARTAIPGWLGSGDVASWIRDVHGEVQINCHTRIGPQCAGAAIYRANVCKLPHSRALLVLPPDRVRVFASPPQFQAHHASVSQSGKDP